MRRLSRAVSCIHHAIMGTKTHVFLCHVAYNFLVVEDKTSSTMIFLRRISQSSNPLTKFVETVKHAATWPTNNAHVDFQVLQTISTWPRKNEPYATTPAPRDTHYMTEETNGRTAIDGVRQHIRAHYPSRTHMDAHDKRDGQENE